MKFLILFSSGVDGCRGSDGDFDVVAFGIFDCSKHGAVIGWLQVWLAWCLTTAEDLQVMLVSGLVAITPLSKTPLFSSFYLHAVAARYPKAQSRACIPHF